MPDLGSLPALHVLAPMQASLGGRGALPSAGRASGHVSDKPTPAAVGRSGSWIEHFQQQ